VSEKAGSTPLRSSKRSIETLIDALLPASSNYNDRGWAWRFVGTAGIQEHSQMEVPRLANERRILVERSFEALAKEGIQSFDGLPGFWRDSNGSLDLGSMQNSFEI